MQYETAITIIIKGFQPNYIKPSMKTDKYEIGV